MWKNVVEQDGPQMTVWSIRFAYWIPKATDTHSEYAFFTATMVARTRLDITL